MTPAQAKRLAVAAGYFFYWDSSVRMWACYPENVSVEASYHTWQTLEHVTAEQFKDAYLRK